MPEVIQKLYEKAMKEQFDQRIHSVIGYGMHNGNIYKMLFKTTEEAQESSKAIKNLIKNNYTE